MEEEENEEEEDSGSPEVSTLTVKYNKSVMFNIHSEQAVIL